jgi:hypothetical protein
MSATVIELPKRYQGEAGPPLQELLDVIVTALEPLRVDVDTQTGKRIWLAYLAARRGTRPDAALNAQIAELREQLGLTTIEPVNSYVVKDRSPEEAAARLAELIPKFPPGDPLRLHVEAMLRRYRACNGVSEGED